MSHDVMIYLHTVLSMLTACAALCCLAVMVSRHASPAVCVRLLRPGAQIPERASDGAAGYDLRAAVRAALVPGERVCIPTGVGMDIPHGWCGMIWPRSGLARHHGIDRLAGLIDSDYRGEIGVILINTGDDVIYIEPGDRIAQIVIGPAYMGRLYCVETLDETERGADGYGSTGVR